MNRHRFVSRLCMRILPLWFPIILQAQPSSPPYQPNWESLRRYETPEWYRDAKFGIFIHWGAYSVPAFGTEWYPREMYQRGTAAFNHHVSTYGPQSKVGYKDLIARFRAERFNPDQWADLFVQAGARYVVPVAEHHDGFAMYDCSLSRWNALKVGPRRDVIGELASAVRRRGLVFGLSSHRAEHWWFMNPGRSFDSDVNDPAYADLYGPARPDTTQPDSAYLNDWYARCAELADKYHPQIFYFDWWIEQPSFAPYLQRFAAYYYNSARQWGKGVVINYKNAAFPDHTAVLDIERGRLRGIRALPWQTDTSIGKKSWGYIADEENKSAGELIPVLADIVSKNGCLLLNIGPKSDGTISAEQQKVLRGIGAWLSVNGEAIYATRPWEVFGEGVTPEPEGMFSELRSRPYTSEDIRFTAHGPYVYAIVLGWPGRSCRIRSVRPDPGSAVTLLGYSRPLEWSWDDADGLQIALPESLEREGNRPCLYAYAFRIKGTRARVLLMPRLRVDGKEVGERYIFADSATVEIRPESAAAGVFYTLDGTAPTTRSTPYTGRFTVRSPVCVKAVAAEQGCVTSLESRVNLSKTALIRSVAYRFPCSARYQGDGALTLADGEQGSSDPNDGKWLGFEGVDADFVMELKTPRQVHSIRVGCLENQESWIFLPRAIDVSVSADGGGYRAVAHVAGGSPVPRPSAGRAEFSLSIGGEAIRYLRVRAENIGLCPPWHKGSGGRAWLFLDEVILE